VRFPRYLKYKPTGYQGLQTVPEQWSVRRFQRCVTVTEGQVDPESPQYSAMPLLAPNHIESGTGRVSDLESAGKQAAESGKYLCRKGDVVYSKIRPGLRKVAIAVEDASVAPTCIPCVRTRA
jgi:type I restriction enzyme S subunit